MMVKISGFRATTTGIQQWTEMLREDGYMYQLWQQQN